MKTLKKVLAAVLAMAMVLGMMAMSTFAEDAEGKEVMVTVKWDGAEGDMSAWVWGAIENYDVNQTWPGDVMTNNGDGTWSGTWTITDEDDTTFNFIPSCSLGQTVDIKDIPSDCGHVVITVGAQDPEQDNKYTATFEVASIPSELPADAENGVSSVMVYVVAAVVAVAAAAVVVCKRRSVEA